MASEVLKPVYLCSYLVLLAINTMRDRVNFTYVWLMLHETEMTRNNNGVVLLTLTPEV